MPKTYVLDTSVLLSDPRSFARFEEHEVVVPLVVLTELEAKRNHPELGWAARQALRALEELRTEHGTLVRPFPINEQGGTLRVEINHQELAGLPVALRSEANDHRILAVARNLANEGADVAIVTKDLPLRLKASIVGLAADEYRNDLVADTSWTGFAELDVDRRPSSTSCSPSGPSTSTTSTPSTGAATSSATPGSPSTPDRSRPSPASTPTSGCTSCAPTPRCSTSAAARPSSASPSTC